MLPAGNALAIVLLLALFVTAFPGGKRVFVGNLNAAIWARGNWPGRWIENVAAAALPEA
jgi:hypothetical protein